MKIWDLLEEITEFLRCARDHKTDPPGHFVVSPEVYEQLLRHHTPEELQYFGIHKWPST